MRKNIAIYIEKDAVWEAPLGPFANSLDDADLIDHIRKNVEWEDLFDAEPVDEDNPDAWRDFRMEIRTY